MNDKNTTQNLPKGEVTVVLKGSEPSEKEYGCEVCKHSETCEPTPFGICNKFERK